MPKIIEDVKKRILHSAEDLFREKGYEQTDMREIAGCTGIAVGTIYRHFADKEDLYIQVMSQIWNKSVGILDELSKRDSDPRQLFQKMTTVLVEEIAGHQSLSNVWAEITAGYRQKDPHFAKRHAFVGMHTQFAHAFGRVLGKISKLGPDDKEMDLINRLGSYTFVLAVSVALDRQNNRQLQTQFITDIILHYAERVRERLPNLLRQR